MVIAGVAAIVALGVSATAVQAWPHHGTPQAAAHPARTSAAATAAPTAAGAGAVSSPTSGAVGEAATAVAPTAAAATTTDAAAGPAAPTPSGDVIANLFEWSWASVATECTTVLGPHGYGGVQVAPPQDSVRLDWDTHPWWEVYQPAGYDLNSRMGDEAAFVSMVQTCRAAGVHVYVDAVINHMSGADTTADGATSYSGHMYTAMTYPGLYTPADFHQASECPTASGRVEDYDDATQVHFCMLSGLEDLRTESSYVRGAIVTYLNKLLGYGVSGFRVDAAKHIPLADLQAIIDGLDPTVDGTEPYVALEVFGGKGELSQAAYAELGSVLGLDASVQLKRAFAGSISSLRTFGDGLVPSSDSLTFVMNHDTDRSGVSIGSHDAATNRLATLFVLADDYGRAQVYSSFAWSSSDDSPPSDGAGMVSGTECGSGAWDCLDRDPAVLGMVAFRNAVGDATVTNWSDDGADLIAFSRGSTGWTALNDATSPTTRTLQTGLVAGTYCDLLTGGSAAGSCRGTSITVGADGTAVVTVPARGAVAITTATRV
ncbi:alpha-amylase [Cellulomonas soli]|uniref:alpha-amylase n=1 Tax=Cellulomonas soli TaxID=931535 RepID=UPI003F83FF42